MATCPFSEQIGAYHDGELPEPRRDEVERHLLACPACQAELEELRDVSRLFVAAPRARLSQMTLHRLHMKVEAAAEEGLLRVMRVLSAVAASVLIMGSAWLVKSHQTTVENSAPVAPPWADVAMSSDLDTSSGAYSTPGAAWYLGQDSNRP